MKKIGWIWPVIGLTLALWLGVMIWLAQTYRSFIEAHQAEPEQPGVSFSIHYSNELGIDWRQTYLALLNDLQVRRFRLMSYWDLMEPQEGTYKFDDLDFQMDRAAAAGAKVSLAIGLRQPRYPECHQPSWVDTLPKAEQQARLEAFMTAVVTRYRNHPALIGYQLENEGLNTVFGHCPKDHGRAAMIQEFNLVKRLDPSHAIDVNVSNEFGLPLGQPRGDEVGFSIYQHIYDNTVTHRYVYYLFPPWWHGLRAALIEKLLHRRVFVHELQAEPWGPAPTVNLSIEEQSKSMDAAGLLRSVNYTRQSHIREYYLWGGEWWYWRLTKFNDPSLWNAAKSIYKD